MEEHFYLVFPALAWCLTRRPSATKFITVCVLVLLAGIGLRSGVWLHDNALDPPRNWYIEDIYYPTWNRLDGLLAGVVLATIAVYRPALWARMGERGNAFALLGLAMMALALWLFRQRGGLAGNSIGWPVLSAAIACLVVAAAGTRSWIGRWRVPGAAWIAAVSYSLYLSHKPVFSAVEVHFDPWLHGRGLLAFAVYAVATLAVGAALHYAVERPFLQLRALRHASRRSTGEGRDTLTAAG